MTRIRDIFELNTAQSHSYNSYQKGSVAFVSNGFSNNGVVGYVEPQKRDKVINKISICVSAFCEATVQLPPFIARGNGGSGLVILTPLSEIKHEELLWYASYINESVKWRFSFGRMVVKDRLVNIEIPNKAYKITMTVGSILPKRKATSKNTSKFNMVNVSLIDMFDIKSGDYHKATDLNDGETPLISCGKNDNGLVKYCDIPEENIYQNSLTVAYNGAPLTTNYHPYYFAAKDDVAILMPKKAYKATTVLFIQMILNSESWRYSYGRKCFREKLSQMSIKLPMNENEIDEVLIEQLMKNTSYWDYVESIIKDSKPVAVNMSRERS